MDQEPNVFAGGSVDPALLTETTVTVYLDQCNRGRDEVIIAGILASDEFFAKQAPLSQAGNT